MRTDWKLVLKKSVPDYDGFLTDYSWYVQGDHHVFILGDTDRYKPEDGDWDWECDSWVEAQEWFACYNEDDRTEEDELRARIEAEVDEMLSWMKIRNIQNK